MQRLTYYWNRARQKQQAFLNVLLLCFFMSGHSALAQTYTIESFQGVKTTIRFRYKPFGQTVVSCLSDSFAIATSYDFAGAKSLGKRFLQVFYHIQGGSNVGRGRLLLLCVDNGRLRQSLHLESYAEYEYGAGEGLNELRVQLTGHDKSSYQLLMREHEVRKSHPATKADHSYWKTIFRLRFDPNQDVFYTAHQAINKRLTRYDEVTGAATRQLIQGSFPVISWAGTRYVYRKQEWSLLTERYLYPVTSAITGAKPTLKTLGKQHNQG